MRRMDGDARPGPLSYDVRTDTGEASAQRPILAGGLVAVAMLFLSLVTGWFALGFVPDPVAIRFVLAALTLGLAFGACYWAGRGHLAIARRRALFVVAGVALVTTVLTYNLVGSMKPALPQVKHSIDSVDLPDGFRMLTEETRGDRFCRRGCPTVERTYAAPAGDPDPVRTFILAMFDQGWEPANDVEPELATLAVRGTVRAQLQEIQPHVVEITVQRIS
jgi:hypothetical protein